MIYRPIYVNKIMAYVDTPFVKVLTGVRRCGKSAILKRKIEKVEHSKDLFSQLLPLMDVTFVRNGQLTVIPFPFKYLREYIGALGR